MENIIELESNDLVKDNIEKLKEIFPDIVKDGKIDFDTLKLVLGEEIENEKESYKFEWVGKKDCYKTIQTPSNGTLKYIEEDSLNPDIGENIIIEGDNLEVLKLLQSSYKNSIKMIYIDPPYNTGNDFVYPDNYETPLDNYLELTGQKINGETTQSKKSSDGRKHTQWLNMIFPRLLLSRTLLKEDGVIFISIDDNEYDNLKKLCDEIFGEENYISTFIITRSEGGGLSKQSITGHDYLLSYSKNITKFKPLKKPKDIRGKIIIKDNEEYWIEDDWLRKEFGKYGTCPYNEIEKYYNEDKKLEIDNGIKEGKYTLINKNGIEIVGRLRKISEDGSKFYTIMKHLNKNGVKDLEELGMKELFSFPKPKSLIFDLIQGTTFNSNDNDIILDFFGGSGTTGQSVLELNKVDGKNRKFILVQLPEKIDKDKKESKISYEYFKKLNKPTVISEITKERIRRVINGYGDNPQPINDGFKVFKLDKSNYKINEKINVDKNSDKEDIIQKLRKQFRSSTVHDQSLVEGYKQIDIIYENIIKEGYNLNSKIEVVENIDGKVYKITDSVKKNKKFYLTFDKVDTQLTQNKEFMGISTDTLFICFDHNLSDSDKLNLSKTFLLKTM